MNSKSSCRPGVGTLIGPDGKTATCDKEKADLLDSYFGYVCTVDDGLRPQIDAELRVSEDSNISHIVFTEANVLKAARRIKTKSKFVGDPDGYMNYDPYCVAVYHCFITLLCLLDKYVTRGRKQWLPLSTRKARRLTLPTIVPFHRLDSIFCKLMERVIAAELSDYLLSRGVITRHQHGFIAKRSSTTNLLDSLNDWTLSVENKRIETIVYVDFARAFNTVSHEKLQLKLQTCGISGKLLLLISIFLHDRSQVTKVGRHISQRISLIIVASFRVAVLVLSSF